jgi:hypothetical protein
LSHNWQHHAQQHSQGNCPNASKSAESHKN